MSKWSSSENGRKYFRDYYHQNKHKKTAIAKKYVAEKARKFWQEMGEIKCSKCPESDRACLDFHHVDPKQKIGCVSVLLRVYPLEVALEEAKKCIVLCANCHRKLHFYS